MIEKLEGIIFGDIDVTEMPIPERLELAVEIASLMKTVDASLKIVKDAIFDHVDEAEGKKVTLANGWYFDLGNRPKYSVPPELEEAKKDIENEIKKQRVKETDGFYLKINSPKS